MPHPQPRKPAGMGGPIKIVVVLAMKGCHQRYTPLAGDAAGRAARQKRRMRMHHIQGHLRDCAAIMPAEQRYAHAVGLVGNAYAGIQKRLKTVGRRVANVARRYVDATVAHALQSAAIGHHDPSYAIQLRRIGFGELRNVQKSPPFHVTACYYTTPSEGLQMKIWKGMAGVFYRLPIKEGSQWHSLTAHRASAAHGAIVSIFASSKRRRRTQPAQAIARPPGARRPAERPKWKSGHPRRR